MYIIYTKRKCGENIILLINLLNKLTIIIYLFLADADLIYNNDSGQWGKMRKTYVVLLEIIDYWKPIKYTVLISTSTIYIPNIGGIG